MSPVFAMICGLLMASGVHAAKATVRPVVTATTGGIGNPVVSFTEDVVSGATTLVAVILPAVAALLMLVVTGAFIWFLLRRRRRRRVAAV
jgi:heme/copper-type cytochrome/quinol oxidase subunit 2